MEMSQESRHKPSSQVVSMPEEFKKRRTKSTAKQGGRSLQGSARREGFILHQRRELQLHSELVGITHLEWDFELVIINKETGIWESKSH